MLPHEICSLVFTHCDLEECLALSETCTAFRDSLIDVDSSIVRRKVKNRVPWMDLGGSKTGINTWIDCARIIRARTQSMKDEDQEASVVQYSGLLLHYCSNTVSYWLLLVFKIYVLNLLFPLSGKTFRFVLSLIKGKEKKEMKRLKV